MKKIIATLMLFLSVNTFAAEFDGLNTGIQGKYVWRGITFNNQSVQQGDTGFTFGDFNINAWWNQDLADEDTTTGNSIHTGDITEIDYTISYNKNFNNVGFILGYIFYNFPAANGSGNTEEVFVGLSYESISASVYIDLDESQGSYLLLDYSKDFVLEKATVTFNIGLGFNDGKNASFYYKTTGGGISDLTISLSTSFTLSDKISINPYISYSELLGKFGRVSTSNDNNRAIWSGVNIAMTF